MLTLMVLVLITVGFYKAVKASGTVASTAMTLSSPLGWLAKFLKK